MKKRIISIILTLSVIAVTLFTTVGIIPISAAISEGNYTIDTETADAQWIADKSIDNLLSGCYLREYRGDGLWDTNNPNEKDRLSSINDNDLSTYSNLYTSADPVMYSFNPKKTLSVK